VNCTKPFISARFSCYQPKYNFDHGACISFFMAVINCVISQAYLFDIDSHIHPSLIFEARMEEIMIPYSKQVLPRMSTPAYFHKDGVFIRGKTCWELRTIMCSGLAINITLGCMWLTMSNRSACNFTDPCQAWSKVKKGNKSETRCLHSSTACPVLYDLVT
jgi:hypothetical protein